MSLYVPRKSSHGPFYPPVSRVDYREEKQKGRLDSSLTNKRILSSPSTLDESSVIKPSSGDFLVGVCFRWVNTSGKKTSSLKLLIVKLIKLVKGGSIETDTCLRFVLRIVRV